MLMNCFTMIELKKIFKSYAATPVLKNISFNLERDKFTAIIGPNGCGKTTLLKIVAGWEQADQGALEFSTDGKLARPKFGFIFQEHKASLFPWLSVEKNIAFALKSAKIFNESSAAFFDAKKITLGKNELLEKILNDLNLQAYRKKFPYQLSGGIAQLTAIGRALAFQPDIFLLDEPFSQLDYYTSLKAQQLFINIWEKNKIPALLVTHSIEEAILLADKIIILSKKPAGIIQTIDIDLARPRRISQIATPSFLEYQRVILQQINSHL